MAMATLYAKYDLSKALCSWSHVWLEQWRTSCWINVSTPELLCISYALGHRDTFWDMSKVLIKNYTKAKTLAIPSARLGDGIIPERLVGRWVFQFSQRLIYANLTLFSDSINTERDHTLHDLEQQIELIIASLVKYDCPEDHRGDTNPRVWYQLSEISHYFKELSSLGLWPMSARLDRIALVRIPSDLYRFSNYASESDTYGFQDTLCNAKSQPKNVKRLLFESVTKLLEHQQGLCITCVKEGRVTRAEGNCRTFYCSGDLAPTEDA